MQHPFEQSMQRTFPTPVQLPFKVSACAFSSKTFGDKCLHAPFRVLQNKQLHWLHVFEDSDLYDGFVCVFWRIREETLGVGPPPRARTFFGTAGTFFWHWGMRPRRGALKPTFWQFCRRLQPRSRWQQMKTTKVLEDHYNDLSLSGSFFSHLSLLLARSLTLTLRLSFSFSLSLSLSSLTPPPPLYHSLPLPLPLLLPLLHPLPPSRLP
jgi:hypothetical protein